MLQSRPRAHCLHPLILSFELWTLLWSTLSAALSIREVYSNYTVRTHYVTTVFERLQWRGKPDPGPSLCNLSIASIWHPGHHDRGCQITPDPLSTLLHLQQPPACLACSCQQYAIKETDASHGKPVSNTDPCMYRRSSGQLQPATAPVCRGYCTHKRISNATCSSLFVETLAKLLSRSSFGRLEPWPRRHLRHLLMFW